MGHSSADIYADEEGKLYSDEWCTKQLEESLKNYDLNMEYFSLLSRDEFNNEIRNFLSTNNSFIEVFDLNLYDQKSGYYLMVLDEYCQLYIGTTDDIKNVLNNTGRRPNLLIGFFFQWVMLIPRSFPLIVFVLWIRQEFLHTP